MGEGCQGVSGTMGACGGKCGPRPKIVIQEEIMETVGTYTFSIEDDGIHYQCKRIVRGNKKLKQTIHVFGIGAEEDGDYGPHHRPPETMEGAAGLIARAMIRKSVRETP